MLLGTNDVMARLVFVRGIRNLHPEGRGGKLIQYPQGQIEGILFCEVGDAFNIGSSNFSAHLSHLVHHVPVLDRKLVSFDCTIHGSGQP